MRVGICLGVFNHEALKIITRAMMTHTRMEDESLIANF